MYQLTTLTQVKNRLKYDQDDDDADLEALIFGASRMVLNYLRLTTDAYLDSDGQQVEDSDGNLVDVPEEVQVATAMLVGILNRDPSGVESSNWAPGYLPAPITAILYPLRDPALA